MILTIYKPEAANSSISHETKTVVVFDFHSNPHEKGSLKNPVINWVANRAFYEDLVRLAPLFPSVRFIIRGKDAQWLDIPYFQKVRDAVLGMDNIIVDQDYSVLNRSYLLAAEADVIIARHTSIGDELLAAGTPVIFHDYTPNCSGIVSSVFDYEEFPLFVHDFGQLKHRLEQALDGEYMDDATWDRLQSRYYANSFDGCVRERIQAGVKALLKDKASGARQ